MTTRILGKFFSPAFKGLCLLASTLLVASCGGGGGGGGGTVVGGGGIGGTGSVASVGVVTAIASVEVNGVKFSCVGATVTTDDGSTAPSGAGDSCVSSKGKGQLREGMVVVVKGSKDSGGNSTAATVTAESNVTGPAVNIDPTLQSFTVLSQFIDVDDNTLFEITNGLVIKGSSGLSFLAGNPIVRVSGLPNAQGRILATFVEIKTTVPSTEFEVKGVVTASTATTISIGSLNVILNGQATRAVGKCVEIKGTFDGASTLTLGSLKDDDDCSGSVSGSFDQAQVEGIVSGVTTPTDFLVAGQSVKIDANTVFSGGTALDLINGVKVEAEGSITNGVLLAKKLTIKSNGVRIEGRPDAAATGNSFTILGITVKVVAATEFNGSISLGNIGPGASIRIEGSKTGAKQVTASKITNGSGGGGGTRTELRGPLDTDPDQANKTFQILGVPINAAGASSFQDLAGNPISSATFFATVKANDIVKGRGSESPDNAITASEVEIED